MKRQIALILIIAMAIPTAAIAQRSRRSKPKEKTAEELRIERMTEATQQVMFIDSIVTSKSTFLEAYTLGNEAGTLVSDGDAVLFINELGNKRYYARGESLCSSDFLGDEWSAGEPIKGITDSTVTAPDYPFVLSDGITLYYAAKGSASIGGYDIFATRYNSTTGRFFKPENIGMPFNSTANDYMYAIDEQYGIGFFATDRGQDEGKVCIYIFALSDAYHPYGTIDYTTEELSAFARIASIADTQVDKEALAKAQSQLAAMRKEAGATDEEEEMAFVINDKKTYHNYRNFKSKENYYKYKEVQSMRRKLEALNKDLEAQREVYAKANASTRRKMTQDILRAERQQEDLEEQIAQKEKEIRNAEQ